MAVEKALVLQQCAAPGASVAKVAMSHGLNANIVHGWRKLHRRQMSKRATEALWKANHCMSTIADRARRRTVCT